jgi:hypothetical protein
MATITDLIPYYDTADGLFRNLSTLPAGDIVEITPTVKFSGTVILDSSTDVFSVAREEIRVADNYILLNDKYTTAVDEAAGFAHVRSGTGTTDTGAAGGFASGTTVTTTGAATFSTGDYVLVTGAAKEVNNGLYEVATHAANVLTIQTAGLEPGFESSFTTDASDTGYTISGVNIFVIRFKADGSGVQIGTASTGNITYSDLASTTSTTLQTAYDNDVDGGDATITTNATDGAVVIAGNQKFQVTATNGLDVDTVVDIDLTGSMTVDGAQAVQFGNGTAISTFTVDATGAVSLDAGAASNFTVDGGNLVLNTTTSGEVLVDGIDGVEINSSGGAIDIGNDADAQAINVGTGAAARTITIGNNTTTTAIEMNVGATGQAAAWKLDDGTTDFLTLDTQAVAGEGQSLDVDVFLDYEEPGGITATANGAIAPGELVTFDSAGTVKLADANTGTTSDAMVAGAAKLAIADAADGHIYTQSGTLVPMKFSGAPAGGDVGELVYLDNTAGQAIVGPPAIGGPTVIMILGVLQESGVNPAKVLFQPMLSGKA